MAYQVIMLPNFKWNKTPKATMTDAVVNLLHMSDMNGLLGTRFVFIF